MLERIDKVQGIGLLHDVNAKPLQLQKGTLVYGENGRGKSTLAAIFRSVASGTGAVLAERQTIDGQLPPAVTLRFSNGVQSEFTNGAWTKTCPEFLIFDNTFIDDNVHSGGAVTASHRKNLLHFALGTAAVEARKKEEQATGAATKATELLRHLTAQLAGYHVGTSLMAFGKLVPVVDADEQIAALQKRLVTANSRAEVLKRPVPRSIELPRFDVQALFGILNLSLEDIQEDAERLLQEHLARCEVPGLESWISTGQQFGDGEDCPYCGQVTKDLPLIRAYRTHFNAAYTKLKVQVTQLRRGLEIRTGEQLVTAFMDQIAVANAQRATWALDVELPALRFDPAMVRELLQHLQHLFAELIEAKERKPTDSIGTETDRLTAQQLWEAVLAILDDVNEQIQTCAEAVEVFKNGLALEQPAQIQDKINTILLSKRRQEPAVIELLDQLPSVKKAEAECAANKKKARESLDEVMAVTLKTYEKSINALLSKFGAAFRIEAMDSNFRGGSPRTEYGLRLRGRSIPLEGGQPKFETALSEGDKRTLAFAFFIASATADPNLGKRIVVVDDPVCSLDKSRRHHTKNVLKALHAQAEQLIVLAHDSFFLRDLRDELLPKDGQTKVQVLQVEHAAGDYSTLGSFDIDAECASPYYRHHRMVQDYCREGHGDHRNVAKALRPFLEGYMHRRFPTLIPSSLMFGQAINYIKESKAPNPVSFAQPLIDELHELNGYAGQFHHDTNPDFEAAPVDSGELRSFCSRALHLVYSGQAAN